MLRPILGDHHGRVLGRGELRVEREGDAFFVRYFEHRLPLSPRRYRLILEPMLPELAGALGEESDAVLESRRANEPHALLASSKHDSKRSEDTRCRIGVLSYQGCELWELRLVDPDNRHPIDWLLRRRLLAELRTRRRSPLPLLRELVASAEDGRIKMYLTMVARALRRALPELFELFEHGDYRAVQAEGPFADHVIAFARASEDASEEIVAIAPRFTAKLVGGRCEPPSGSAWADTVVELPRAGHWRELFTGEVIEVDARDAPDAPDARPLARIESLLAEFPLALLRAEGDQGA